MNTNPTVLIVDDDSALRQLLRHLLQKNAFQVFEAKNRADLMTLLANEKIDLILLDIMLNAENGFDICSQLRKTSSIPIIMLTAVDNSTNRVLGLELGADDYVTKPFYPLELVARIKSVLRRLGTQKQKLAKSKIIFSGWTLYPTEHRLFTPENVEISLSAGEYFLLNIFLNYPNHILTREKLLAELHTDQATEVFDRSIDVQISRLRKHLEVDPKNPKLIKTIRNSGYLFSSAVEEVAL